MNWKDQFPKENIYYQTDNGILYKGDCLEILKEFPEKSIDLVLTDPPYGTNSVRGKEDLAYKDNKSLDWLLEVLKLCVKKLRKDRIMYVLLDYRRVHYVAVEISKFLPLFNEIVWKIGWISGFKTKTRKKWVNNHSTILQFGKYDNFCTPKKKIVGGRKGVSYIPLDTVWDDIPSILQMSFAKKTGHPDEKPLKLFERLILPSVPKNGILLDPFMGSGTTAIACEKLNYKWVGIEISEKYCEITKQRLEKDVQ